MIWRYFLYFHVIVNIQCEYSSSPQPLPNLYDDLFEVEKHDILSSEDERQQNNVRPVNTIERSPTIWTARWCRQDIPPIDLSRWTLPNVARPRRWCTDEFRRINEPPPEVAGQSNVQPPRDLSRTGLSATLRDNIYENWIELVSDENSPIFLRSDYDPRMLPESVSRRPDPVSYCELCGHGPYVTFSGRQRHMLRQHNHAI